MAGNCQYLFFFCSDDENDENRMMTKKAENFSPGSNPGHLASFSGDIQLNYEHIGKLQFEMYIN